MPEQPPERDLPSHFLGVPFFWVAIGGLASAVTMPIRYGEGLLGVGRNGFFAVIVIFGYAAFGHCPALISYGVLFIGIAVIKRLTTLLRHRFGRRQPSAFEGWPLACLVGIPPALARLVIEPGMVYFLGRFLKHSDPALGWFFIAGAVAAAMKALFETTIQFNRDLSASDIRIQMEIDAERRARRGW